MNQENAPTVCVVAFGRILKVSNYYRKRKEMPFDALIAQGQEIQ